MLTKIISHIEKINDDDYLAKHLLQEFINNVVADLFADMLLQPKGRGHINSEEIKDIINNLKNQPLSNKNLLLSNQNKDKLIDYIEEVNKSTNDFKEITNYSLSVDKIKEDFEENHNSIEDLRKRVKLQNEEIKDLQYDLSNKDNEISTLKSKIEDLKDTINWKDKFQRVVKYIHDKIHAIFGDKGDKYKEMADNLFINGIMDEKEYISVINKKEKNRDDFER